MLEPAAPFRNAHSAGPERLRPLTVAFLVGSIAPDGADSVHCGVRDYALRLAKALGDAGVDARVIAPPSWRLRDGLAFIRMLRAQRLDIIHLQYPSIGHRYSLLPHLLGLSAAARRCLVTLHEHSALPYSQRTANQLFRMTADQMIFTTGYESQAFGAGSGVPVIPIGSNVPTYPGAPDRDDTVLYFGQIRPGKGIEDFLTLATLAEAAGEPNRFVVIGSTPPRWRDYSQSLRSLARPNVAWVDDAPLSAVAQAMATAMAAYLPFPDGASLRRGSLMAALSNGLPVIAPFGPSTTELLRAVILDANTPEAALSKLQALHAAPEWRRHLADAGRKLLRDYSWDSIAAAHLNYYQVALDCRASLCSINTISVTAQSAA